MHVFVFCEKNFVVSTKHGACLGPKILHPKTSHQIFWHMHGVLNKIYLQNFLHGITLLCSVVVSVLENIWATICHKKIERHLHENLTIYRFEDINLTEPNCRLCSLSLGYMCGVQCTEDQKSGLPTSRDFICFRFTFRKHLGKQHREAFCWLVLWSLMIKNRRQWLMCQAYNDQRTRQIITIIWWVLPAVSLV